MGFASGLTVQSHGEVLLFIQCRLGMNAVSSGIECSQCSTVRGYYSVVDGQAGRVELELPDSGNCGGTANAILDQPPQRLKRANIAVEEDLYDLDVGAKIWLPGAYSVKIVHWRHPRISTPRRVGLIAI